VGFHKAPFLVLCFFFFTSMIFPRWQWRMLILPCLQMITSLIVTSSNDNTS
jgi:hypothetical protein